MSAKRKAKLTPSAIVAAVESKIKNIRTRTLDISFNELLDMYGTTELKIDPEFQRLFRWNESKQSQFIESLILEMPIPPIYVIELETNRYELIDGLQRISTYLHFRGRNELLNAKASKDAFLELEDCDIVTELNGLTYETLPLAIQIKLKRNFIRMEILRKESDPRLRYYLFKRLNTGGALLSEQEIRNCTIRLLGEEGNKFNKFIIDLSKDASFKTCIQTLTENRRERKEDQELVLRFFAFKNDRKHYVHDVGDFMSSYMENVAMQTHKFDYDYEEATFKKTFEILKLTLGKDAFQGVGPSGRKNSKLLSYHYEAFTLGLQAKLQNISLGAHGDVAKLKEAFLGLKKSKAFIDLTTGGGKNYANQLEQRIAMVEKCVTKAIA